MQDGSKERIQQTAWAGIAVVLLALLFATWGLRSAHATTEGRTAGGEAYVSGGVGLDEREALAARRQDYSLRVMTAVKGSGAYLADVQLRIADAAGKPVMDVRLDGPWLLAALQPGRYTVQAGIGGQTLQQDVSIRAGGHHEMIFYFGGRAPSSSSGAQR